MKKQLLAVVFLAMQGILFAANYNVPCNDYSPGSSSSSFPEKKYEQMTPLAQYHSENTYSSPILIGFITESKKEIAKLKKELVESRKVIEELSAQKSPADSLGSECIEKLQDEKDTLQGEKNALVNQKKFWVNTTFAGAIFIATYATVKYLRRKYIKKTDWLNKKSKEQLMLEKVKPLPVALVTSSIFMAGALIVQYIQQ